jgi:hypothetical protein
MKTILVTVGLVLASSQSLAQSVENLWRARGLEADQKTEALNKKKLKDQTSLDRCKQILEAGFSNFTSPSASKIAIKKFDGDTQFALRLVDGKTSMIVFFRYEPDSKIPAVWTGGDLGDWTFMIPRNQPAGAFGLRHERCAFIFDPKDYLNPSVNLLPAE